MSESTVIGCTRRSEPKLSAAACNANPRRDDKVPPSQCQLNTERSAACAPDSPWLGASAAAWRKTMPSAVVNAAASASPMA